MMMAMVQIQPELFDRRQYRQQWPLAQVLSWPRHSRQYEHWRSSRRHDRQKYEALIRQRFRCYGCGYLLGRRYDVHHSRGYDDLGYEEASDLVAVHRECHRRLEDATRRDVCGCTPATRVA